MAKMLIEISDGVWPRHAAALYAVAAWLDNNDASSTADAATGIGLLVWRLVDDCANAQKQDQFFLNSLQEAVGNEERLSIAEDLRALADMLAKDVPQES